MKKELLLIMTLCLTIFFGYQLTNERVAIDTNNTHTITVKYGDTIWGIAERIAGNEEIDVRSVVYAVKELNTLEDGGDLRPGTTIKVPSLKKINTIESIPYIAGLDVYK